MRCISKPIELDKETLTYVVVRAVAVSVAVAAVSARGIGRESARNTSTGTVPRRLALIVVVVVRGIPATRRLIPVLIVVVIAGGVTPARRLSAILVIVVVAGSVATSRRLTVFAVVIVPVARALVVGASAIA